MHKAALIARILLAIPLIVFGLNGFLEFLETPEYSGEAGNFLAVIADSYIWPLKDGVEIASGVMILTGIFLPLGLVLAAPVVVNIVGFHVFMADPATGVVGYIMLALGLFLAWCYAPAFNGLFNPTPKPIFRSSEESSS